MTVAERRVDRREVIGGPDIRVPGGLIVKVLPFL